MTKRLDPEIKALRRLGRALDAEDACDALMEHAYAEGAAMAHSQLAEARVAWRGMVADLIAVKGHLDSPYPDDNRWTPWQRFVERGLRRMEAALEPNPAKEPS